MHFADQGREDVGVLKIVIVSRPVEIGRHDADEIGAVLPVVRGTHLDAGDLGDGVGLVGGFQHAGKEMFLLHRLRRVLGVDAA